MYKKKSHQCNEMHVRQGVILTGTGVTWHIIKCQIMYKGKDWHAAELANIGFGCCFFFSFFFFFVLLLYSCLNYHIIYPLLQSREPQRLLSFLLCNLRFKKIKKTLMEACTHTKKHTPIQLSLLGHFISLILFTPLFSELPISWGKG